MIFCLSAVVTGALAYDERKEIQPEALVNGCLHFATWIATEHAQDYFNDSARPQDSISSARAYLQEFAKFWSRRPELEKEGRSMEAVDLICFMIHTTESHIPAGKPDEERLGELGLEILCRLPTMRGALIELASR